MGTFAKSRLETRIMTGPILGAVGIKTRREGIETPFPQEIDHRFFHVGIKTRREGIETTTKYLPFFLMEVGIKTRREGIETSCFQGSKFHLTCRN